MAGAPSNGRKKSKIGLSQKPPKPSKALPSKEPLPEVTAPRYSDAWMEQIDTRNQVAAIEARHAETGQVVSDTVRNYAERLEAARD